MEPRVRRFFLRWISAMHTGALVRFEGREWVSSVGVRQVIFMVIFIIFPLYIFPVLLLVMKNDFILYLTGTLIASQLRFG